MNLKIPENDYRPVPFWSWNDKLEIPELLSQIHEMHKAGLGGFFMHARAGLRTEYFSDEWFAAVRACVREAETLGMHPWLYDENGWPSGFGCGMVNSLGLDYQQKYLRMEKTESPEGPRTGEYIGTVDLRKSGNGCLRFYYEVNPYYVDTLNPVATQAFITNVYERYHQEIPADLWKYVKGFFTDEPQISRKGIPWSFVLDAEYKNSYGRNLLDELPSLFMQLPGYQGVRVRFWKMITRLFMTNFMKPIHSWCEHHDCRITGHHLLEETYLSQLTTNGAIMPQYLYYHIPGIDWLTRNQPSTVALIQLASVCAQTGKRQLLAETFALCGWNLSFQDMKWLYQCQMVRGINLLCQHLEGYSIRGLRKRDYPPSLFVQQPWWSDYKAFNDYVSRVGMLLTEGDVKCNVLILHGQSTAWTQYNGKDNGRINDYFLSFDLLSRALEGRQVNFHYGDEALIEMLGSVDGKNFVIGQQRYTLLVIPMINNISGKEKELLNQFIINGGRVLGLRNNIENRALTVEGEADNGTAGFIDSCKWFDNEADLVDFVAETEAVCGVRNVADKTGVADIIATARSFADFNNAKGKVYILINQNQKISHDVEITFQGKSLEVINAESGKTEKVFFRKENNNIILEHKFPPAGLLMVFVRELSEEQPSLKYPPKTYEHLIPLNGKFELKRLSDNALTLDFCRYYVDGKLVSARENTIMLMPELLKLKHSCALKMEFDFNVSPDFDLNRKLNLIIENPEQFKIYINGDILESAGTETLYDHSFHVLPLKGKCIHGKNMLTLETLFFQKEEIYSMLDRARCCESEGNKINFDMELESIYISGDFSVINSGTEEALPKSAIRMSGPFEISEPIKYSDSGALVSSGLPFFAGKILLRYIFDLPQEISGNALLQFDNCFAQAVSVKFNGNSLGNLYWQPYELIIPGTSLQRKNNIIEFEIVNGLRNLLGPHHLHEGESFSVTPLTFFRDTDYLGRTPPDIWKWTDEYTFVNFGISGVCLSC